MVGLQGFRRGFGKEATMEIGKHIKGLRAEAHMSQDDLAARVYV